MGMAGILDRRRGAPANRSPTPPALFWGIRQERGLLRRPAGPFRAAKEPKTMDRIRRRIVEFLPLSAWAWSLAACGERAAAPAPGPAPATPAPAGPPPTAAPPAPAAAPGSEAGAIGAPAGAAPPAGTAVQESEPQAVALGYVTDAQRADRAKFPKYAQGQRCATCALYAAAPTAPTGPCSLFGGRAVAGPGWCSAWVQRS